MINRRHRVALGLAAALLAPLAVTAASPVAPVSAACTISLTNSVKAIAPGASNANVVCIEQRLVELGYPGIGTPDNSFGTASVEAVKHFQESRGMYRTGWVTSTTARQMGIFGGIMPPANAARVTIIGDSTSAAMRWYDEANYTASRYNVLGNSYDLQWALESCRRLVITSCTSRTDTVTNIRMTPVSTLPLMKTTLNGKLGEALVIMAGYDDTNITNAIDPIMAEAKLQGVAKVYWLNYRTTNQYNSAYQWAYPAFNLQLEAAKVKHPNLVVLDWNGYSKSQSSAVQQSWFSNDQIHLTGAGATALANYIKVNLDAHNLQRCDPLNANTGDLDPTTGISTATTGDTGFVGIDPVRMLDTRYPSTGGTNGRLGGGRTVTVSLDGEIPADAEAAALSVTAVDPCRAGYATVFDCDVRPDTSNLNFVAGRTTAAMAITPLGEGHTVCVYSSVATDIIVDVHGAFTPGGNQFQPLSPTRWIDTRGNDAVIDVTPGMRANGSDTEVQIAGQGGVPGNATAVWLNLTGVTVTANTFLTVYPGPCGTAPLVSNVNILKDRTAASAVLVGLGTTGSICIRVGGGSAHLVVDVAGSFSPDPGLVYHAGPLERIYNSRPGPTPPANEIHAATIDNVSVLNVTSVGPTATGFVSTKPCGVTDTSSLINNFLNETTANATAISPGTGSQVCTTASVPTDIIVDLLGEFVTATS